VKEIFSEYFKRVQIQSVTLTCTYMHAGTGNNSSTSISVKETSEVCIVILEKGINLC